MFEVIWWDTGYEGMYGIVGMGMDASAWNCLARKVITAHSSENEGDIGSASVSHGRRMRRHLGG
jgi:hypothetical protein